MCHCACACVHVCVCVGDHCVFVDAKNNYFIPINNCPSAKFVGKHSQSDLS